MTTPTFFLPVWNDMQFFDQNGNILAGGKVFQYEGGSYSVQQTTYQTPDTSVPNPQPIVLDMDGRMPSQMWGQQGLYYNLLLTDSTGAPTAPGRIMMTAPNIIGIQASAVPSGGGGGINVWNASGTPTYISGVEFLLAGNHTTEYAVGNRVQFINGVSTFGYGTVVAVTYSSPNTYVTLQNDSIAIGSNLTAVFWSSMVATGPTVDAAGVSYSTTLTYPNADTVGGQIKLLYSTLASDVATVNTALADRNKVYPTTGTFSAGGTAFVLTPTPAATGLTVNESYDIDFNTPGGTTPTLNISGLGAKPLVQLKSDGTYVAAIIANGQTTRVLYNGFAYVVQNAIPPMAVAGSSLSTNGYWKSSDGFIIQWGQTFFNGSTFSVSFPITFPHAAFSANISQPGDVSYGYAIQITSLTTSGMSGGQPGVAGTLYWQAFGW